MDVLMKSVSIKPLSTSRLTNEFQSMAYLFQTQLPLIATTTQATILLVKTAPVQKVTS